MLLVHPSSTCDVCLDAYVWDDDPEHAALTPHAIHCGHIFCKRCLENVIPPQCPLCRKRFLSDKIKKLHLGPADLASPRGSVRELPATEEVDPKRTRENLLVSMVMSKWDAPSQEMADLLVEIQDFLAKLPLPSSASSPDSAPPVGTLLRQVQLAVASYHNSRSHYHRDHAKAKTLEKMLQKAEATIMEEREMRLTVEKSLEERRVQEETDKQQRDKTSHEGQRSKDKGKEKAKEEPTTANYHNPLPTPPQSRLDAFPRFVQDHVGGSGPSHNPYALSPFATDQAPPSISPGSGPGKAPAPSRVSFAPSQTQYYPTAHTIPPQNHPNSVEEPKAETSYVAPTENSLAEWQRRVSEAGLVQPVNQDLASQAAVAAAQDDLAARKERHRIKKEARKKEIDSIQRRPYSYEQHDTVPGPVPGPSGLGSSSTLVTVDPAAANKSRGSKDKSKKSRRLSTTAAPTERPYDPATIYAPAMPSPPSTTPNTSHMPAEAFLQGYGDSLRAGMEAYARSMSNRPNLVNFERVPRAAQLANQSFEGGGYNSDSLQQQPQQRPRPRVSFTDNEGAGESSATSRPRRNSRGTRLNRSMSDGPVLGLHSGTQQSAPDIRTSLADTVTSWGSGRSETFTDVMGGTGLRSFSATSLSMGLGQGRQEEEVERFIPPEPDATPRQAQQHPIPVSYPTHPTMAPTVPRPYVTWTNGQESNRDHSQASWLPPHASQPVDQSAPLNALGLDLPSAAGPVGVDDEGRMLPNTVATNHNPYSSNTANRFAGSGMSVPGPGGMSILAPTPVVSSRRFLRENA